MVKKKGKEDILAGSSMSKEEQYNFIFYKFHKLEYFNSFRI